jgi:predicted phosphodiesterase
MIAEPALVHASPESLCQAPAHTTEEEILRSTYSTLGRPVVAFGHTHIPFVRQIAGLTIANSGSVDLPFDGDPSAAYLLIENSIAAIRRIRFSAT